MGGGGGGGGGGNGKRGQRRIILLVMVIMEHAVWLPRKPRCHLNPRVVNQAKVEDVQIYGNVHTAMYGRKEERCHQEHLVEGQLQRAHGHHRIRRGGVVAVMVLVDGPIEPRGV